MAGYPTAQVYLAQAAWGRLKKPYIGVRPLDRNGERPAKSVWRGTDALACWTWPGHEGQKAEVEVYADADTVELCLNNRVIGRKKLKECRAVFTVPYQPGTLTAAACDKDGNRTAASELRTAGTESRLRLSADRQVLPADGESLCYVVIEITDKNGILKMAEDRKVELSVTGPGTLIGFGSAKACTEETFNTCIHSTFRGRALAVIRSTETAGPVRIGARADGLEPQVIELNCIEKE